MTPRWLITFTSLPDYRERFPNDTPKVSVHVDAEMEGRATSMGWDQLLKLRRFATTQNHLHYSTVRV